MKKLLIIASLSLLAGVLVAMAGVVIYSGNGVWERGSGPYVIWNEGGGAAPFGDGALLAYTASANGTNSTDPVFKNLGSGGDVTNEAFGNLGSAQQATFITDGAGKQWAEYDGVDDNAYIVVNNIVGWTNTLTGMTVIASLNIRGWNTSHDNNYFLGSGIGGVNGYGDIQFGLSYRSDVANRGDLRLWARDEVGSTLSVLGFGIITLETGVNYQVAATYDGTWFRGYFNGGLFSQTNNMSGPLNQKGPFTIGGATNGTWMANARVTDVEKHTRAMSATEITNIYENSGL